MVRATVGARGMDVSRGVRGEGGKGEGGVRYGRAAGVDLFVAQVAHLIHIKAGSKLATLYLTLIHMQAGC